MSDFLSLFQLQPSDLLHDRDSLLIEQKSGVDLGGDIGVHHRCDQDHDDESQVQMKGHDGPACSNAGKGYAKCGSPPTRSRHEIGTQELPKPPCGQSDERKTGSAVHRIDYSVEAATCGGGARPVIVTTADAPIRKLSSGFSTSIRTGKRWASRTQSRLRGTFGRPPVLVPYSGTTAHPGPTTLPRNLLPPLNCR